MRGRVPKASKKTSEAGPLPTVKSGVLYNTALAFNTCSPHLILVLVRRNRVQKLPRKESLPPLKIFRPVTGI